jgi:hypothetical protein
VEQDVGQLGLEGIAVLLGGEVAALATPAGDRAGHASDHLLDRPLALRRSELAAEVFLSHDVGRVLRPAHRELHAPLLEGDAIAVADQRIPLLPLHGVERMLAGLGEVAADLQAFTGLRLDAGWCLRVVLHTDMLLFLRYVASGASGADCLRRNDKDSRMGRTEKLIRGAFWSTSQNSGISCNFIVNQANSRPNFRLFPEVCRASSETLSAPDPATSGKFAYSVLKQP